jgi:outer membrane lipoprotein-sorting protein
VRLAAKDLLARLDARSSSVRSFRALAEMRYTGPQERLNVKEVVLIERPDRLRIEMMSPFGVALQIATDGRRLCAYIRDERTYYTGEATPENLARFTRLELGIHDITDLLVGLPPGRERRGRPKITFEEPTALWRVSAPLADGGTQILWFDHEDLLPVRSEEVDPEGVRRYTTSYGDYREIDGVDVPHHVRLEISAQNEALDLSYSNVTLNLSVSGGLFRFEAPPGAKLVDLDQLAYRSGGAALALRRH